MSLESNKLIADFIGMKYAKERSFDGLRWTHSERSLSRFETDWEWLMPVVKKISDIFGMWDYDDDRRTKAEDIFYIDNMFSEFIDADKSSIYSRVVEFIEWYNKLENKTNN